jgi:deoxyribodipyrimidine photo-lyase
MLEYKISLFLFHRDLRLQDNTALFECIFNSEYVIPCFILIPDQIGHKNKYKSNNCIQFMIECLKDLNKTIHKISPKAKLNIFHGNLIEILDQIWNDRKFNAIYETMDYTPYSLNRNISIDDWCLRKNIHHHTYEDILLHSIRNDRMLTTTGTPYKKFTPFYKFAKRISIPKPKKIPLQYWKRLISFGQNTLSPINLLSILHISENPSLAQHGGRKNAINILKNKGSLSAFNKFGCISIREVYWFLSIDQKKRIRGLYWRDFYYRIAWYFPFVIESSTKNRNFKEKFGKLKWNKNLKNFNKWCEGKTGFPIVDACMQELNQTGFINNRMRLIVSSFLIKDLHINWEEGEKYFATKLIDYDPAQNNGNWQWVAGSGVDSQPIGRLPINPWNQSKKYDPKAEYIKKWIPELVTIPPDQIHEWNQNYKKYSNIKYPSPIIDHEKEKIKAVKLIKQIY